MRVPVVAAGVGVLATLMMVPSAARAADDGPWCYRDFGGPQYTNCSFYSARQCLAAAGTLGGVCERNHAVPARPARAHERSRRK